jgi:hypothetical protein
MGLLRRRKPKSPPPKQRPFKRGKGPLQLYRLVPARVGVRAMFSPMRQIESRAFARGASGSQLFGNLFLFVIGARAAKKAMKRKPHTLTTEKLAPGQGLSIRTANTPKRGMSPSERQQGLLS